VKRHPQIFILQYSIFISSLAGSGFAGEIKVLATLLDVLDLDNQFAIIHAPDQWCRITAALDFVNQNGRKASTAVSANNMITFLVIAFAGRPANIAGIECRPDNAV